MGSFLISEAGVFSIDKIFEKLCSSIKDKKERAQLIEKLKDKFARYFKEQYEHLSLSEEFDIYSLQEYLLENIYTSVSLCFTADTSAKRSFFKDTLIKTSYNIAGADTKAKKQLVFAYVDSLLEIIKNEFLSKFNDKELFLVNQKTEEIISALESYTKNNREELETYIKYRGSFAEYIDSIKPLSTSKIYLHYLNPEIGFVRRDVQFKFLDDFLNDSASLLSLAITGYGGIGKSRLMYEYIRDLRYNLEWKAVMLDRSQVDKLNRNFTGWHYPKNLLVVIDYAAEKPKEIGEWIRAILQSKSRPPKMRIVMLERQGLTEINEQIIQPHWYQQISEESGKLLSDIQYQHGNGFYELPRFNREEMLRVMDMLPGTKAKLTQDEKESIYNKILGFSKDYEDERFNTPLIALLLTDAYINECDKDIENLQRLNPQHLMSYVTKRNRDSWERAFTGFENKEGLVNSLERLMVYATATGGCDLINPPLSLVDDAQLLFDRLTSDRVNQLLTLIAGKDQQHLQLEPLKPDIIGEYFVLNYINEHRHSDKCKNMVAVCWEKPDEFLFFLGRCTRSYLGDFTHLIFGEQAILFHGAGALVQAKILWGMTATPNIKHCQKAVEHIENLYQEHREPLLAELFAWGLFNLSAEQGETQALEKTADKIKAVYDKWPDNQEIALAYERGLANLSVKQFESQAQETVDKIKAVYDEWQGNQEIALTYAIGLFNLYGKQKEPQALQTIDSLKVIYNMWPDSQEVALIYAKGLVNLSADQEELQARHTIGNLKAIYDIWQHNHEITTAYVAGLYNLSYKQDELQALQKTADKIKDVYDKWQDSQEIALVYASGLVNLSAEQDELKALQTVDKIKNICDNWPDNQEIALAYTYSLGNLSAEQNKLQALQKTADKLKPVYDKWPDNQKVALACAYGLVNLSAKQDEPQARETVDEIKAIYDKWPDNQEIASAYTYALENLSNKKD